MNSATYFSPSWISSGPRTEAGLISFVLSKQKSAAAVGWRMGGIQEEAGLISFVLSKKNLRQPLDGEWVASKKRKDTCDFASGS